MDYILETYSLKKDYGNYKALNGLNMKVPKGAIYGFVGKNGAGKTTLIRLICGLQKPSEGGYSLYGCRNTDKSIREVRKRLGAIIETPAIYSHMSAIENMEAQYRILGVPYQNEIQELLELVGLGGTAHKKVKDFSLGMRQRLGIAIALAGSPDFLILDEPVNGLDPQGIIEIRELIMRLNKEYGITMLISSHILDELAKIATHFGFIDHGQILKELSAEELSKHTRKCLRLTLTDTKAVCMILDEWGIEYSILSQHEVDIFGDIKITELVLKLSQVGCEVQGMQEHDESLENFYINLVGGHHYA